MKPIPFRPVLLAPIALLLGLVAACGPRGDAEAAGKDGEGSKPKEAKALLVRAVHPEIGELSDRLEVTARVVAFEKAPILPRVDGVVTALHHREGERVEAGAILAELESQEQTLERDGAKLALDQAALAVTQAQLALDESRAVVRGETVTLENERRKLARARQQHEERVISDQDLEAAQYTFDAAIAKKEQSDLAVRKLEEDVRAKSIMQADAARKLQQAELRLEWCRIRATITGTITVRNVSVGQRATMGQAAFEIEDLDSLVIEPSVPEKELRFLRRGLPVEVNCTAHPGEFFRGEVVYVANRIDPEGGKILSRIRLEPRADRPLLPGMFVQGHIITRRKSDILLLPKKSLLFERDRPYVFIVDRGEKGAPTARKTYVRKGLEDPESVEYLPAEGGEAPLTAEAEIILVGLDRLVDGAAIRVEGDPEPMPEAKAESPAGAEGGPEKKPEDGAPAKR
ncbi:MAG: efflux RND transporter periplasmic adaptor subunit [Planctomycetota bacterium]